MSHSALERDARDLAAFGYRQRLDRTLGSFSSFAAGFSYLSILTGSSQLFHVGYAAAGPAFFWTWPAVFAGQFLVALCFAELAARFPLSGGVYQWSTQVGSGTIGWMAGWVFLACSVITLASVALALQTTLPQISPGFQLIGHSDDRLASARNAVLLGCVLIVFSTFINAVGVRLLARINNVGVIVEMIGAILLIALLASRGGRGPEVVFDSLGRAASGSFGFLGPALAASLMASFVLYGFDTAGMLAEETDDPRRRAPRAILMALAAVGTAGSLLVFTAIRAAPDLLDPGLSHGSRGLPYIVTSSLGAALGTPFLVVVAFSITVCTLAVHAAAVRLAFAMARDGQLPFSRAVARIPEGSQTPTLPAFLIGVAGVTLLVLNANFPNVIEFLTSLAVVWANLAYLLVTLPLLIRRLRPTTTGWAATDSPGFNLGRWGLPINLAAVAWGVVIIVNIGWPRAETYGNGALGRLGAAPATAAMLAVGWLYHRLAIGRRSSAVLDEHRANLDPHPEISC